MECRLETIKNPTKRVKEKKVEFQDQYYITRSVVNLKKPQVREEKFPPKLV